MSKRYSEEFERKAIELYLSRNKDGNVAAELGIAKPSLFAWYKKYQDELNSVRISDAEELRRLRKENACVQRFSDKCLSVLARQI